MDLPRVLVAVALCAIGCQRQPADRTRAGEPGQVAVRLALNWFPEAEHGGYYAAAVHGLYAARGLQVDILGGGPDAPVIQRVATGEVDFGVVNADDVLNARAQQAPVVGLLAPYQINPRCLMVHASSGITEIGQIRDLTLAMSQRPAFSHYLRYRYRFPGVTIVPYPGNVAQFLVDRAYAQQGYVFSEPYVARSRGAEPRVLLVADTGFNPSASVLIATETTIADRPAAVAGMVRAAAEGWERYLADPAATNERIHQLNPEMSPELLSYGASESRPLVLDEEARRHGIGTMSAARWDTLQAQMVQAGLLQPGAVRSEEAFTARYLP
jgi:NitT/TauT family transport system substrate-binding protein